MRKFFLVAFLLLSLLHQSFAAAGQGLMVHAVDGLAHAVLHWNDEGHHHHDDGSYHQESSDESVTHLQGDNALSVTALPLSTDLRLPCMSAATALADDSSPPASPVLDGPRRPPRFPA